MILLELAQEFGLCPKKKGSIHGGEYASPCPKCGGKDRFLIWPNKKNKNVDGSYWCRQCNIKGDSIQFCRDFLGYTFRQSQERCSANPLHLSSSFIFKKSYLKPQPAEQSPKWQIAMKKLCDDANRNIEDNQPALEWLRNRGIPLEAIREYKLGSLSSNTNYSRKSLEMPTDLQHRKAVPLFIPKGITIPTLENNKVLRVKVRRSDWQQVDTLPKYFAISGSLKGLNLIGSREASHIIAVESELDAYAIHWTLEKKALVVAVGSNTKQPDALTDDLIKSCNKLVVICDNDDGGKVMESKWRKLYPKATTVFSPVGKDVGEAFSQGYNIRFWLERLLA